MSKASRHGPTGLRQYLDVGQQTSWMEGLTSLPDAELRSQSMELRFKYLARFQKLLVRPQARHVFTLLRIYGQTCIPMPRRTERQYWSVSCLPSTSDKPLVRVNASWMELFTIHADGEDVRARFILHLSDFGAGHAAAPEQVGAVLHGHCALAPGTLDVFLPRGEDIVGINVRGAASIQALLATPCMLRAIRRFNLTHMNRGKNAYQASHCYSVADRMLDG